MPSSPFTCLCCGYDRAVDCAENVADFEYGTPGRWSYDRCGDCGAWTIRPLPDAAVLARAYPPDYHAYHVPNNSIGRAMKRQYWRGKARACIGRVGKGSAILDVGCGNGDFLSALRDAGAGRLAGIDFNAQAVATARAKGFDVVQGELGDSDVGGDFDAVVLNNVIEHVYDPCQFAVLCRDRLRPSGLMMGETPNTACWDRSLFGRYWGGYHTPRHICLFDVDSLQNLGERSGFAVVEVRNLLQPAHWALSLQNLFAAASTHTLQGGRSAVYPLLQLCVLPANVVQWMLSHTTSVEFIFEKAY